MSDSEDDNYATFGVPLDPIDEENLPRKKPVTIEEQYAYDAQGRRRFHGAFTGGFSAGYFNTVGTRDGWRPQQFKSSRSSKAENITQRPEDFMDEEDTSEFGIAPKGIRTTSDYANHEKKGQKRERVNQSDGPIPGVPVLKELLKPVKETVGITLLKKMGWKPGQGVGSRLTKKEKAKVKKRNEKIRASQQQSETITADSSTDDSDDDHGDITFAPDDYEPFRCNPKDNYFGIGYSGLERRNILSGHINLFDTPAFSVQDKNKKLSIHGQAFGVGAFEADDEDIYAKEDMSRYDFALGPERKTKSRWSEDTSSKHLSNDCLEGFLRSKTKLDSKKVFPPPELPKDFVPLHIVRKSRFYPPIENIPRTLENGKRRELTAIDRARILEDTESSKNVAQIRGNATASVASNIVTRTLNLHGKQQVEERQKLENQQSKMSSSWLEKLNARSFVKGEVVGLSDSSAGNLKQLDEFKASLTIPGTSETNTEATKSEGDVSVKPSSVKPFLSNPDKQKRFEQYLDLLKTHEKNKLESIQPLSMTEWDREQERVEFEQAARLFEQSDYIANKFTEGSDQSSSEVALKSQETDVQQAAKMKMFGKLTRERIEWKPASIVCKRFNIPEPKVGCALPELQKKSTKFSIFASFDWNTSTKFSKATDTVPNKAEVSESIKEKHITNEVSTKTNDKDSENDKNVEPVSEKMKIFEASYEKVFGKEIQERTTVKTPDGKSDVQSALDITTDKANVRPVNNIPASQESETSQAPIKNKTEEKKDLFKAIFLSSSEDSESEPEESVDSEAVKSVLIGKVPSEVNVQRNTSPPRGIFAKLDLDNLLADINRNKNASNVLNSKSTESLNVEPDVVADSDSAKDLEAPMLPEMYGPALPARLMKNKHSSTTEPSTSQPKPVFRSVVVPKVASDTKISGKWVERSKLKKSKKEKKYKHKEHKSSKHKRKSKKDKR